ncbi:ImmA/IrrE family metallo-endopeptidase [Nostoc sp. CENA67]|uniref:ImmA/IrrE family metallo-endopeptidase n=1 Tax=Amazonocrinis nigriterrae CENA67 TaxID=2794033 RepID=A0A8J7LD65_9NOST|nr:ImmA/IrrE family metallo-endopeptidase [Amazonocrinis nigriterrae]MBH8567151.1 ImmA/IrrE family metallo-endopeptidase [Amazonocrinis nigriterrae CENA67]
MAVRRKYICKVVERLIKDQCIQAAPIFVEELARALGVEVQYQPADDKLSGFLIRDFKNHCAVIGVNSSHHKNRQRFTIAHELGHFLLHEGEKVHVDRIDYSFQVKLRNEDSSKGINLEEKEANYFAAELLMPASFLKKDLTNMEMLDLLDEEGLKKLADSYRVSTQALTFRLAYLGYIQL